MAGLAKRAQALSEVLSAFDHVTIEADGVLAAMEHQLDTLNSLVGPIASRAVPLTLAEANVAAAVAATDELLQALMVSRKV